jgi:DNA-binding MarR family transcriptional regulator
MLIKLTSDHIQSHSNRLLNKINLTASQFRYLEYLNRNDGPVSFKDFEKYFQTSQPTVSGIMRRLAEKDLIVINAAGVGHAKNARLAEKGQKLIDKSGIERGNEENLILSALHEDEREVFHDMLERINNKLSE